MGLCWVLCKHVVRVKLEVFVEPLTGGVRVSLILSCACGTFFLLLVASTSLDMKVYVLSYCILLCQVQLTSLGRGCSFLMGNGGAVDLGERG